MEQQSIHTYSTESERLFRQSGVTDTLNYLYKLSPRDMSDTILIINESVKSVVLHSMNVEGLVSILNNLPVDELISIVDYIPLEKLAAALDAVQPNVAADVLRSMDWGKSGKILSFMTSRKTLGDILLYPDDKAGGLMNINLGILKDKWSTTYAVNVMRMSGITDKNLRQLFVLDENGRLVGTLELSKLVFAAPGSKVADVMDTDVHYVLTDTDQEDAARISQRYNLLSLPVVDAQGHLQGAISTEDIQKIAQEEATEDMYHMAGVGKFDSPVGSIRRSIKSRLPWLIGNIVAVLIVASVIGLFESTIKTFTALAIYLPMIMNQSGVVGTQISTVIVRSLAINNLAGTKTKSIFLHEYVVAIVNASVVSVLLACIVGIWRQDVYFGGIILFAMLISYFAATSAGIVVPIFMRQLKIDPATASGVILTTLTDLISSLSYLGFATFFIKFLQIA